ncbi:MAG: S8 family serine peptidase [Caldilineaceae bacterium]
MSFMVNHRLARTYLRIGLFAGGLLALLFFVTHSRFATDSFAAPRTPFRFIGTIVSTPDNPNGFGDWVIRQDDQGGETIYTVAADQNTDFGGTLPTTGQQVEVRGDLQVDNTVLASRIRLTGSGGGGGQEIDLKGLVITAPVTSTGQWVIRLNRGVTKTIVADANTRFDHGVPVVDQWVEVKGTPQADGTLLAKEINPDSFEANEVVVRLGAGVVSGTVASRYHLTALSTLLASGNIYLFGTVNGLEQEAIKELSTDSDVIWAELNFVGRAPTGNPARIFHWGGTDASGYVNQSAFTQIDLAPALAHYDGAGTIVAVLDTGVDLEHPALAGHLTGGWDMVADDAAPQDDGSGLAWGHGTHIAGIIAHIAPASLIMPVRVLDTNGRGNTFMLAYAIEWAANHGANVVNLSLGTDMDSHILHDTVNETLAKGVIIVAAAGNDNQNVQRYPVSYPGVIGVTAVDGANVKADFANYSPIWVDMAAPGVGITSTVVGSLGSGYASWSGTSMATAFVSGAAALLHQKYPQAGPLLIRQALKTTGQNIDALNPTYVGQLGKLLDIGAAANTTIQATATPTPTPTQTPIRTPSPTASATPIPEGQQPNKLYLPILKKVSRR